ncbi:MAG: WD40 repeat domain-containing protein [Pseudonocardiaceae bacterium]
MTGSEPNWDVRSQLTGPMRLVFSPAEEFLACVGAGFAEVYTVRTAELVFGGTDERLLSVCAAFSPDGQLLALGGTDRSVRVYETGSWAERARFGHDSAVWCVAFSPDGRLLASGTDLRTAHVWDLGTGQERVRLHHAGAVLDLAFGPGGTTLLTGSQDGTAQLWPIATERLVAMARARATRKLDAEERERFLIGTEVQG